MSIDISAESKLLLLREPYGVLLYIAFFFSKVDQHVKTQIRNTFKSILSSFGNHFFKSSSSYSYVFTFSSFKLNVFAFVLPYFHVLRLLIKLAQMEHHRYMNIIFLTSLLPQTRVFLLFYIQIHIYIRL